MQTITKADLAKILADEIDCKNTMAKQAVDVLFETLAEAIIEGERIEIRGFGSWEVKRTNARPRARNPRTGEEVYVPARRKVGFKPAKYFETPFQHPSKIWNKRGKTDLKTKTPQQICCGVFL